MSLVPRLQQVPDGLVCLPDYEAHARNLMQPSHWSYVAGAAADGSTAEQNPQAWGRIQIVPRLLRSMQGASLQIQLLGRHMQHPVMLGPVAYQKLAHDDGEIATAHAAAAQGAGFVLSTLSSFTLEDVAAGVDDDPARGPLWFQLYFQRDRAVTQELVARAEAAGYEAIVVTADATLHGARDAQRRAGFRLPLGVGAANLARYNAASAMGADVSKALELAPTWDDLVWLRGITALPLILKGVLHADDAGLAVGAGVNGVIVSNHGGRTLDTAVTTAWALPRIVDAVEGRVPILVDGGIRRGTDVLKAMALGARAVMIGQPQMWGLAAAGAAGVAHVLKLLQDELAIAMVLSGCNSLADATPALLRAD